MLGFSLTLRFTACSLPALTQFQSRICSLDQSSQTQKASPHDTHTLHTHSRRSVFSSRAGTLAGCARSRGSFRGNALNGGADRGLDRGDSGGGRLSNGACSGGGAGGGGRVTGAACCCGLDGVSTCYEYSRWQCSACIAWLMRGLFKYQGRSVQHTKFVTPAGVQMLLANSRVASWSASLQAVETQHEMASMKLVEEQMPLNFVSLFTFQIRMRCHKRPGVEMLQRSCPPDDMGRKGVGTYTRVRHCNLQDSHW
jgi:hypothetical protein